MVVYLWFISVNNQFMTLKSEKKLVKCLPVKMDYLLDAGKNDKCNIKPYYYT